MVRLGAATASTLTGAGGQAMRKRRGLPPLDELRHIGRGGQQQPVTAPDGVRLHVETTGPLDAPLTVVFAHGWTGDLTVWRHQRDALAQLPVRQVFYDQRGHGYSSYLPGTAEIRTLAGDLHAVLNAVAPRGPLVLVGHSMGAMSIMALARMHPALFGSRVTATVLMATSAGGLDQLSLGLPPRVARRLHHDLPGLLTALERRAALARTGGQGALPARDPPVRL